MTNGKILQTTALALFLTDEQMQKYNALKDERRKQFKALRES